MDEDEVAVGKVRSAGEVCAEGDNWAKSWVVAEKRDSDRRGRPAGSLVLYKNRGMTPRVMDDPWSTKARREKCTSSAQRLPAARAVRNNVLKNARRRGQVTMSTSA